MPDLKNVPPSPRPRRLSQLKDAWKNKRSVTIVYLLLRASVILVLIAQIFNRNFENVFLCVLTLFLFGVPNMVQQQTGLARDMLEALRNMENINMLKSSLGLRTTFRDCQLYGSSVHKVSRSSTAFMEVESMKKEVLELLGLPVKRRKESAK